MAKNRQRLASLTKMLLTVITTTPVVMAVPVIFMLIVVPPWFRYVGLVNNGSQTQAEVVAVEKAASVYGSVINVDYRFSLEGQDEAIYTGQQSINFDPPPVGSTVQITYSRDNPNVSQIGDGPGIGLLLLDTILFGIVALLGCIPTVALALRIATRIWGI